MTEIQPTEDGFLTEGQAETRDRMESLRDDLAERARTAVNTTYEELLDQAATAGGEDLVEKAALIGTDLIVTGWRWHEGIGTEGYVTVSAVVGETRIDARTAKVRDENSAGSPLEPGSHICFNDSGRAAPASCARSKPRCCAPARKYRRCISREGSESPNIKPVRKEHGAEARR
jgi:hypothetical protein